MSNRLIPVWLLVVIGAGLISLILYADTQVELNAIKWLEEHPNATLIDSNGFFDLDQFKEEHNIPKTELVIPDEIPYFKTFADEVGWYTQFEPTLMIEEPDCDTLVKKYKGFAEFQDRVNYSFRILEVCDLG